MNFDRLSKIILINEEFNPDLIGNVLSIKRSDLNKSVWPFVYSTQESEKTDIISKVHKFLDLIVNQLQTNLSTVDKNVRVDANFDNSTITERFIQNTLDGETRFEYSNKEDPANRIVIKFSKKLSPRTIEKLIRTIPAINLKA